MLAPAIAGLLTGLSLIIAIGAQNAFVLRQGLIREYVTPIVAICGLSDLGLILAGVAGLGALVTANPTILVGIKWFGALFLTGYGLLSLRRARKPESLDAQRAKSAGSLAAAVLTALGFTFLNPHVYLDTVLLLGSIAATHGPAGRWWFAGGAAVGSLLWFSALGYGARFLQRFFASARAWQILDIVIAVVMFGLAFTLLR